MVANCKICGVAVLSFLFVAAPAPPVAAAVFTDPITAGQIDATQWTTVAPNAGITVEASSAGVLMTVAPSASGADLYARLLSTCTLVGDFDVQVDYKLGPWAAHSGVRTALIAGVGATLGSHAAVERVSLSDHDVVVQAPATEAYLADFLSVNPFPDVATTDLQGTFRLTRTGNTESAYFGTPDSWILLYTATTTSEPVNTALQTWSDDQFFDGSSGGGAVTFSNYVVNAGERSCPNAGPLDAGSASDAAGTPDAGTATTSDGASSDGAGNDASGADGANSSKDSSGCGCELATGRTTGGTTSLFALAMLAVLGWRRRR